MKTKIHVEEEADEGYFASVSDLMVGILFVFLLMLTVFALNYRQAEHEQLVQRSLYERLAAQLRHQKLETQRQREAAELARQEAEKAEQRRKQLQLLLKDALARLQQDIQLHEQARQSLLASLDKQLRAEGVQVVVDEHSGVLRLSGDLLFDTGSAALSIGAQHTVQVLAAVLDRTLPCYAEENPTISCPAGAVPVLETVLIEGHTDNRPITGNGRYRDNDELSTERALAVFAALHQDQPELDAIRNRDGLQLLGEAGYGDRRPISDAQGTTPDDLRRNRRIDIRFVLTSRTSNELKQLQQQIMQAVGTK
jgi:flagellar motor protein MotB